MTAANFSKSKDAPLTSQVTKACEVFVIMRIIDGFCPHSHPFVRIGMLAAGGMWTAGGKAR